MPTAKRIILFGTMRRVWINCDGCEFDVMVFEKEIGIKLLVLGKKMLV